jgi:hypothetical protein
LEQKIPQNLSLPPRSETVKKKQGIPEREVILACAPFSRQQVLRQMANHGVGDIDTPPPFNPEFPAKIYILAVHEIEVFVKPVHLLECFPAN